MTNALYSATIEALEAYLAPRVVSRSLQEGLKQLGKTPATVDFKDVEAILKDQVYRQLQVTMPVHSAKDTIGGLIAKLKAVSEDPTAQAGTQSNSQRTEQVAALKEALKPYNLYFEWPEVQKLRAQVKLLETQLSEGRELGQLLQEAKAQLEQVKQKLEDQLVAQAREQKELELLFEQVETLGGAKVRRLESLIGQIGEAQARRQLAPAEIARAQKIGADLRKLMASGVIDIAAEKPDEPALVLEDSEPHLDDDATVESLLSQDTELLEPQAVSKLQQIDLEQDMQALEGLKTTHAPLFAYKPGLEKAVAALGDKLSAGQSVQDELARLEVQLEQETALLRQALTEELEEVAAFAASAPPQLDPDSLNTATQVSLSVLETGLPPHTDIQKIRDLYGLAQSRLKERQAVADPQQDERLEQQAQHLARLQATLLRHGAHSQLESYTRFEAAVSELEMHTQDAHARPDLVGLARSAEATLERAIAEQAASTLEREQARVRSLLAQLLALPKLKNLERDQKAIRDELERQLEWLGSNEIGDEQIRVTASLVDKYQADVKATYQQRLNAMSEKASRLANKALLGNIQEANEALERGRYIDLSVLEQGLQAATETKRQAQLNELHKLETEARQFSSLEVSARYELSDIIETARGQLERGDLLDLARAWALLANLRNVFEQRTAGFEPRLDAALETFKSVAKLNNDEVTRARLILEHLNSQRDAFQRVSTGVQNQLERSLTEAESLLESLKDAFEATRDVASQLVSANMLDDVLGLFDETSDEAAPETDEA